MTSVTFKKNRDNEILEFTADGHTNYGVEGEDIVCAAVSSIIQTAALGILIKAQVQAKITRDDKRGYLKLELPIDLTTTQRHDCNVILDTMVLGLADLAENYSDFIELSLRGT
jgi:hypothetical protein